MRLLAQTPLPLPDVFFGTHSGAKALAGGNIGTFISKLLPNVLVAAGIIFFLLILGGGFMMIKSSGDQGTPQDAAKAKAAVTYAIIGFLLVISAFFIMQIIGVITGVNFLNSGI